MTFEELQQFILGILDKSIGIRDEQRLMANTAKRVGGNLGDITEILRILFLDYLNQPVKTDSDVEFKSLQSPDFITKIAGWIITALGDSEFRDIIAQSFQTRNFAAGPLGAGVGILNQEELQTDKLLVRKLMFVLELAIQKIRHQGGILILSPASMKISKVIDGGSYWKCFFENDRGKLPNEFLVDDQARLQNFNGDIKYLWSRITATGDDYIHLSKTDKDGEGIPSEGDDLVQLGNRMNVDRQDAVLISSVNGEVGIVTYFGINSFDLSGKEGSWFGKHGGKKGCVVRGELHVEANSSGLANLSEWGDAARDIQEARAAAEEAKRKAQEAQDFIDNVLPGDFASLQAQIDGQIESFFYNYDPTLLNIPASSWTTVAEKDKHLNDTFTNTKTGASWRFTKSGSVYSWTEIADTATKKALQLAGQAQDTADSKRRVFVVTPVPPYETGDLWTQGTSGDLMRCKVSRTSGNHVLADWEKASKYTDDTTANTAKTKAEEAAQAATTAKSAADAAQGTANTAKSTAESANIAIGKMSDDNIISSFEKPALKKEWDAIVSEKVLNDAQATRFGVDKTAYGTAYNTLSTFIGTNLNTLTTDWSVAGTTLRSNFKNYYDARTTLLNNISYNAKQQAAKAESDAKKAQDKANTLETTVGQQGTLISSLDGKYTAQASQISGLQTKIDAVPGKIEQSVSGVIDWTEGKITETKDYAEEIVSNVDLGTRNLITNRQNIVTDGADYPANSTYSSIVNSKGDREATVSTLIANPSGSTSRYVSIHPRLSESIRNGVYMFSFDYKTNHDGGIIYLDWRQSNHTNVLAFRKTLDNTNGEWKRGWLLCDWSNGSVQNYNLFSVTPNKSIVGNSISYRNIKLVRGNKGWDDSEAPEDVDARVKAAKEAADTADGKAVKAQGDATALNTKLTGWSADNVISPLEKQAIKETQATVLSEKNEIVAEAGKYGVSSSAFVTTWTSYNTQLTAHSATTPENIPINASLASTQTAYSTAKVTIRQAIAEAARAYSNTVSQEKVDGLQIGIGNMLSSTDITGWNYTLDTNTYFTEGTILGISSGAYCGIKFPDLGYMPDEKYVLSFYIQKISGALNHIGGHLSAAFQKQIYFKIDGVKQTVPYWNTVPFENNLNDGNPHKVEFCFQVAATITPEDILYIQPNRDLSSRIGVWKITKLKIVKGETNTDGWQMSSRDTQNYTDGKIDNIQIGGTNLARYSGGAYLDVPGLYSSDRARAVKATIDGRACLQLNNTAANTTIRVDRVEIPEAGTYTFSFWIKGTTAYEATLAHWNGTSYNITSINITTGWSKVVVTFEAKTAYDIVHINARAEATYITDWKYEKGNKSTDWSPSPEDIRAEINDVSKALGTLDTTINSTFKDGIINKAETDLIKSNINTLNAEKKGIDAGYTTLYNNVYLLSGSTAASNLTAAKTAYNTAHANLISSINTAIADGKASVAEKADVDAKFTAYGAALANYEDKVEAANRAIQDQVKSLSALDAQSKANAAKDAAVSAANTASQAKIDLLKTQELANLDGKITAEEKRAIADAKAKYDAAVVEAQKKADAAKQAAIDAAALDATNKVDNIQIGTRNYIAKKYLMDWNNTAAGISTWGQDADGVYIAVNHGLLYETVGGKGALNDIFQGKIAYKANTRYVLMVDWKLAAAQTSAGLYLGFKYTDGLLENIVIPSGQITKTRAYLISKEGKSVAAIRCTYGSSTAKSLIYDIALLEGNKVPSDIPRAEEDHVSSSVNLVNGSENVDTGADLTTQWRYANLVIPKLKPNTVYSVSVEDIINLNGSPTEYTVALYDPSASTMYSNKVLISKNKKSAIVVTNTSFTERDARLFVYAGVAGSTVGNRVNFKQIMLVEGDTPALSWTPSAADVQTKIDQATTAADTADSKAQAAASEAGKANTAIGKMSDDNIISSFEKPALKKEWDAIVSEQPLNVAQSATFGVSSTDYVAKYNTLNTFIGTNLNTLTSDWAVNGVTLRTNFKNYYDSRTNLLNAIAKKAKDLADKAQTDANTAQTDAAKALADAKAADTKAQTATTEAAKANTKLADWSSDSKVSPAEKTGLKQQQANIQAEYTEISAQATRYNLKLDATWTAYNTAYTNANTALTTYTAATPEFIAIVVATWNNIAAYYPKRQALLDKIAVAAKTYADTVAKDAVDNLQIGTRNLLLKSYGPWTRTTGYSFKSLSPAIPIEIGKKYTFVMNGFSTATGGLYASIAGNQTIGIISSGTASTVVKTFTASRTGDIYFYHYPSGSTGSSTLNWAALYEGEVKPPSDWMPAPEDVQQNIEVAKSEVIAGINNEMYKLTLYAKQADYNALNDRVGKAESSITLLPNAIKSTVKSELIDPLSLKVTGAETSITQLKDRISLLVTSGNINTGLTIKPNLIEITGQTVIKNLSGIPITFFGSGTDIFNINNGAFRVDKDGNGTFKGNIESSTGKLGPFKITNEELQSTFTFNTVVWNMALSAQGLAVGMIGDSTKYVSIGPLPTSAMPLLRVKGGDIEHTGGVFNTSNVHFRNGCTQVWDGGRAPVKLPMLCGAQHIGDVKKDMTVTVGFGQHLPSTYYAVFCSFLRVSGEGRHNCDLTYVISDRYTNCFNITIGNQAADTNDVSVFYLVVSEG